MNFPGHGTQSGRSRLRPVRRPDQLAATSDEMLAHPADLEAMYLDESALNHEDRKTSNGENS